MLFYFGVRLLCCFSLKARFILCFISLADALRVVFIILVESIFFIYELHIYFLNIYFEWYPKQMLNYFEREGFQWCDTKAMDTHE